MSAWEQSLIGTVLANPEEFQEVAHILPADFSSSSHNALWSEMKVLSNSGGLDLRSLVNAFGRRLDREVFDPDETQIKGEAYLEKLLSMRGQALSEYAGRVISSATRRSLREVGGLIAADAQDERITLSEAMANAEVRLLRLRRNRNGEDYQAIGDLLSALDTRVAGIRSGDIRPAWTPSLRPWEDVIGYADNDDFVVIAARPGEGKSSLIRNEVDVEALGGKPTGLINLENGPLEYARYLIARHTGINSRLIREPRKLTNAQMEQLRIAIRDLAALPLYVATMGAGSSVYEVISKIRQLVMREHIQTVWIDYLQLIRNGNENRVQDITETTTVLRGSATNLSIPHFAAAQMSRAIETRKDNDPVLADLRESGSIEQDATIVTFMKHIWKKGETEMAATWPENVDANGRLFPGEPRCVPIKLVVAKNRNGNTGDTREIRWHKPTNTFTPMED